MMEHASGIYFCLSHHHMMVMANWQKSKMTRQAPKTKAELRDMLSEAVRNTQPGADHPPKRPATTKKVAAEAA